MDENHISEFVERELSEWNKGNNTLTRVKELIRGAYLAGYAEARKDSEASEIRIEEAVRETFKHLISEYINYLSENLSPPKTYDHAIAVIGFRAGYAESVKDSEARELKVAEAVREACSKQCLEALRDQACDGDGFCHRVDSHSIKYIDLPAIIKGVRDGKE